MGGSPEALDRIAQDGVRDVNEFFHAKAFWRDQTRSAPHNVYTSSDQWEYINMNRVAAASAASSSVDSWLFEQKEPCQFSCVSNMTFTYIPRVYEASWSYDASQNVYQRYDESAKMYKGEEGTPVVASTVVLQRVPTEVVDAVGRLSLETISEGDAIVFTAGTMTNGTWKKDAVSQRTRFFDGNQQEISFTPGKVWVQVLPSDASYSFDDPVQ